MVFFVRYILYDNNLTIVRESSVEPSGGQIRPGLDLSSPTATPLICGFGLNKFKFHSQLSFCQTLLGVVVHLSYQFSLLIQAFLIDSEQSRALLVTFHLGEFCFILQRFNFFFNLFVHCFTILEVWCCRVLIGFFFF